MSIQITKDLLTINTAYNDSIIEFSSSTLTGVTYAEIIVNSNTFQIYPIAGIFNYNFKEIVKVLINQNNFSDTLIPNLLVTSIYDDGTLSLILEPTIKIYNLTTNESISKSYKFIKNVEQLIGYKEKSEIVKDVRILLPTSNHTDYYLPYFEGYPNDFSIYGLAAGNTFYFKNITTINQSSILTSTTSAAKRIYFSDGGYNEITTSLLGLSTTNNLVELWVNNTFKSNINIKRIESQCGVYLKWFNNSGSYSYWLFDSIYTDNLNIKTLDDINGKYDNLQNITSTNNITGKVGNKTLNLLTKFSEIEKDYLTSILTSPKVEMYIHTTPFNKYEQSKFIGVKLNDGTFNFNNKYSNYKMNITITLPELITQTL